MVDPHATRQERLAAEAIAEAKRVLTMAEFNRGATYDIVESWAEKVMAVAAELVAVTERERAAAEALRPFVDLLELDESGNPPGHRASFIGAPRQDYVNARAALAAHGDTPEPPR